jgi:GNAT superfamily N-acetyltransferase
MEVPIMDINLMQSLHIAQADPGDMAEIFELQRIAYQSEALLVNNFAIQPLVQTFAQALEEYHKFFILKAVHRERIIGSVRAHEKHGAVFINKLMVLPVYQDQGIGKYLMEVIESFFPDKRFELFTAGRSWKNISVYEKSGYKRYKEERDATGFVFAYLEKISGVAPPPVDTPVPKKQITRGAVLFSTTLPETPEERYKRMLREIGGRPSQMMPDPSG